MEAELTEIIEGCVAGKPAAQKKLYDKFSKRLFGLCRRYSKDYQEAQDVLQEGFVRIFKNISQFKGQGSFEGWMKKIMVNSALEKYRKTDKLYLVSDMAVYEENYDYENIMGTINGNELMQFISELSPQYKMIFNLYAIEGYNHVEIGKMLGISDGTSKSNLSRARAILQEKIKKHSFEYRSLRKRC